MARKVTSLAEYEEFRRSMGRKVSVRLLTDLAEAVRDKKPATEILRLATEADTMRKKLYERSREIRPEVMGEIASAILIHADPDLKNVDEEVLARLQQLSQLIPIGWQRPLPKNSAAPRSEKKAKSRDEKDAIHNVVSGDAPHDAFGEGGGGAEEKRKAE